MKERPILFSGEMVKAILAGTKTQTRRVIKPQFGLLWGQGVRHGDNCYSVHVDLKEADGNWRWIRCPYGQPGDRLWVREAWKLYTAGAGRDDAGIHYRAEQYVTPITLPPAAVGRYPLSPNGWRSPIHMPRWASRLTLEITGIRVEQVQGISPRDILAEGIGDVYKAPEQLRPAFAQLWDEINAKRGYPWASNPFVWVISFRRTDDETVPNLR